MRTPVKKSIGVCLLAAATAMTPPFSKSGGAQTLCQGPVDLNRVRELLRIALLPGAVIKVDRVQAELRRCGVTFILRDTEEADLRRMGTPESFIRLLRPPSAPQEDEKVWTSLTDLRDMGWVRPGKLHMGSPAAEAGRNSTNEVESDVTFATGFWLDRTEVSNEAFRRFVRARPQWKKSTVGGGYLHDWLSDDEFPARADSLPVAFVTEKAAAAYADWAGKRLPTDQEWEYAARASTLTSRWWGDDFNPALANNGPNLWEVDRPLSANPWGFYNMLGNVWEWTAPMSANAQNAMVRGGGVGNPESSIRAAKRVPFDLISTGPNLGFRCALTGGGR